MPLYVPTNIATAAAQFESRRNWKWQIHGRIQGHSSHALFLNSDQMNHDTSTWVEYRDTPSGTQLICDIRFLDTAMVWPSSFVTVRKTCLNICRCTHLRRLLGQPLMAGVCLDGPKLMSSCAVLLARTPVS